MDFMGIINKFLLPVCLLISLFIVYRSCKTDIYMLFKLMGLKKNGASSKELEEFYQTYMKKEGLLNKEETPEETEDDKEGDGSVSEMRELGDGNNSGI